MTGHPFAYAADAAGHALFFAWPEPDYLRRAQCKGCRWDIPAPGTGYGRFRVEHSKAHPHLTT